MPMRQLIASLTISPVFRPKLISTRVTGARMGMQNAMLQNMQPPTLNLLADL